VTAKDSDREDTSKARGGFREVAETGQIVYSTRLNMERLMMGNQSVRSQWPKETKIEEIDRTFTLPRGHGVWVTKDQYEPFERPN